MIVLLSLLSEYSTAMGFELVTRLAIRPVDSRLRRVVSEVAAQFPVPVRPLLK
jgi:hypothetical protein